MGGCAASQAVARQQPGAVSAPRRRVPRHQRAGRSGQWRSRLPIGRSPRARAAHQSARATPPRRPPGPAIADPRVEQASDGGDDSVVPGRRAPARNVPGASRRCMSLRCNLIAVFAAYRPSQHSAAGPAPCRLRRSFARGTTSRGTRPPTAPTWRLRALSEAIAQTTECNEELAAGRTRRCRYKYWYPYRHRRANRPAASVQTIGGRRLTPVGMQCHGFVEQLRQPCPIARSIISVHWPDRRSEEPFGISYGNE